MSKKPKKPKNEKPEEDDSFGLDMDFEEALERFLKVKPKELGSNQKQAERAVDRKDGN